jgi:hypothetical protein
VEGKNVTSSLSSPGRSDGEVKGLALFIRALMAFMRAGTGKIQTFKPESFQMIQLLAP